MRDDVWAVFAGVEGGGAVGIVPQGLKPHFVLAVYGTAKAVPFHKPTSGAKALTDGMSLSQRWKRCATQSRHPKSSPKVPHAKSSHKVLRPNQSQKMLIENPQPKSNTKIPVKKSSPRQTFIAISRAKYRETMGGTICGRVWRPGGRGGLVDTRETRVRADERVATRWGRG